MRSINIYDGPLSTQVKSLRQMELPKGLLARGLRAAGRGGRRRYLDQRRAAALCRSGASYGFVKLASKKNASVAVALPARGAGSTQSGDRQPLRPELIKKTALRAKAAQSFAERRLDVSQWQPVRSQYGDKPLSQQKPVPAKCGGDLCFGFRGRAAACVKYFTYLATGQPLTSAGGHL